jgi:hypothetical protein
MLQPCRLLHNPQNPLQCHLSSKAINTFILSSSAHHLTMFPSCQPRSPLHNDLANAADLQANHSLPLTSQLQSPDRPPS